MATTPMPAWSIPMVDGVILASALFLLVVLIVVRQLRDARAWEITALLAIVGVGVALRLWLSPAAPLGAWHGTRFLPLARLLVEGQWLARLVPRFWVQDVIFTTNLVIASTMPLIMFAHARLFWRDRTVALAVAALLAVLPLHLRFSRADDFFVQLIALNSLTFCLVHLALKDPSRLIRRIALLALPFVAVATFATRPPGFVFAPFLAAVPWLLYGAQIPRTRKHVVTAAVVLATAYDLVVHIFWQYGEQLRDAVSLETVLHAVEAFFIPMLNPFLHTVETPPVIVGLAVFAFVALRARGDSTRAWFLLGWAASCFVVASSVLTPVAAFQSRYHQHLIEPLVLLAGFGVVELLRTRRWLGVGALLVLLLSPFLHRSFIVDVDYATMREFAFVERLRDARVVPDDCTILEYTGAPEMRRDGSRWHRLGQFVENGLHRNRWHVVETGGSLHGADPVAADARRLLRDPPSCLMLYEGAACGGVKRVDDPIATACAALRRELRVVAIATEDVPNRAYDYNQSLGFLRHEVRDIEWDGRIAGAPPALRLSLLRVEGYATDNR